MNFSMGLIRASRLALACAGVLMIGTASAQIAAPTGYPLVCQGPVNLETNGAWLFTWSTAPASTTIPAQMECAWLDRAPRGSELITGPKPPTGPAREGNTLVSSGVSCPKLQNAQNLIPLAANQYIEVMVAENQNHYMQVQSWVGLVNPPFPAAPKEFPASTPCH